VRQFQTLNFDLESLNLVVFKVVLIYDLDHITRNGSSMVLKSYQFILMSFSVFFCHTVFVYPLSALEPQEIASKAKKFVVKIDSIGRTAEQPVVSSTGFIINKDGQTYTVLTNKHSITKSTEYTLTTEDNERYYISSSSIRKIHNIDLVEISFSSNRNYTVAEIAPSVKIGSKIYAYGWTSTSTSFKARTAQFLTGEITGQLSEGNNGYTLTNTLNPIPGMSGSPLLDDDARVIGIYGRADVQENQGITFPTVSLGIPFSAYSINKNFLDVQFRNMTSQLLECEYRSGDTYKSFFSLRGNLFSSNYQIYSGTQLRCWTQLDQRSYTFLTYFNIDSAGVYKTYLGEIKSGNGRRSATVISYPRGQLHHTRFSQHNDGELIRFISSP
jgi:Trypsin-like peptidase domain